MLGNGEIPHDLILHNVKLSSIVKVPLNPAASTHCQDGYAKYGNGLSRNERNRLFDFVLITSLRPAYLKALLYLMYLTFAPLFYVKHFRICSKLAIDIVASFTLQSFH
jgi:hypothetical protein